jgi:hypothetical protein
LQTTIKDTYLEKYATETAKYANETAKRMKIVLKNDKSDEFDNTQDQNNEYIDESKETLKESLIGQEFCEICNEKSLDGQCFNILKNVKYENINLIAHQYKNEIWIMLKNLGIFCYFIDR